MQVIITACPRQEVLFNVSLEHFTMANVKNKIRSYQVLERTQNSWSSSILQAELYTDIATLENSWAVTYEVDFTLTECPSKYIFKYLPKENVNLY